MVITEDELIASLQNEVRILLHLAGKVEPSMLDYRPTPKQRSTIELLRYLSFMAPTIIPAILSGAWDNDAWVAAETAAAARDLDGVKEAIAAQPAAIASLLGGVSEDDLRGEIDLWGMFKASRGGYLVNNVLCGFAAYRMQLFLYLKSCGREELNTFNLWGGVDAPQQA
jgi:hypothetical protein